MSVRRSPGSPSQISAALLRAVRSMCRSTQFTETLSFPPTNHFACGGFQSHTVFHFSNHSNSFACASQKASELALVVERVSETSALATKIGGRRELAVFVEEGVDLGRLGLHVCPNLRSDGKREKNRDNTNARRRRVSGAVSVLS